MPETFSLDLANLLLFTMPGFIFLRASGYESKSDLAYFMYSMFWGIVLMLFYYNKILSLDKIAPLLNDPYAGAVIFSVLAGVVGLLLRVVRFKSRLWFG